MTSTADVVVLSTIDTGWTMDALVHILGFALVACLSATGLAFAYRSYSTRSIPTGGTVLFGVALVAAWLTVAIWFDAEGVVSETVVDDTKMVNHASAAYLLGVFAVSTVTAELGRRLGDHLGCEVFEIDRLNAQGEVAALLRSAGLVVAIQLPETIADVDGYSPVDRGIKRELAGKTVLFPHQLSLEELRERLTARLRRDFDVDHVHVELTEDGAVDYLAVGSRPDGIGPSLPPNTVAVAIRSDPPRAANVGDPVEVWTTGRDDASSRLVATGTLRATVGDVTTLVVDADHVDAFELDEPFRLVMRPNAPNDVHELASVLWTATETVTVAEVDADGPRCGEFVGWLPGRVLVVERGDEVVAFPADNETLDAGDTVYVLGDPAQLHRFSTYDGRREREARRTGRDGDPSAPSDDETESDAEPEGARRILSKIGR